MSEPEKKSNTAENPSSEQWQDALPIVESHQREGVWIISIAGRLDYQGVASIWDKVLKLADQCGMDKLILDMAQVDYLDMAGAGLLTELQVRRGRSGRLLEIHDLKKDFHPLLNMFAATDFVDTKERPKFSLAEEVGRNAADIWKDLAILVSFVGELGSALFFALLHPHTIRWKDFYQVCERAGVNALPIVALIGFLMGLIMAFQSAVPLQRFGADIYVANLLTISMVRELGPLVTAILLAGRSGSAFAAEIGTMKVNEEVDALKTMGLDPVHFLAVPRVLAAMVMTPVLTIFFNLFALSGGAVVVTQFGYPLITYLLRVESSLRLGDLCGGLFKAVVFSILVAGIGCLRGLNTGQGASSVGTSTTSAVVSGLVLIAVSDGVLAVVFYIVGW